MANSKEVKDIVKTLLIQDNKNLSIVILLKGSWGCGKTYLWKNNIATELKSQKPDLPVLYCSCFGIQSIENLKNNISLEYIKFVSKRNVSTNTFKQLSGLTINGLKYTWNIAHDLLKAVLPGNKDLKLFNFTIEPLEAINEEVIICLDDIERKPKDVHIQAILGLISFLSEVKKFKFLLISNEDKLLKEISGLSCSLSEEESNTFREFKEKTITHSILLTTNFSEMYDLLINNYETDIKNYLVLNKKLVTEIFVKSSETNLRTLQHLFNNIVLILKNGNIKLKEIPLKTLSVFTIEHSRNNFKSGRAFYQKINTLFWKILEKEHPAEEDFINTYYLDSSDYKFYDALYDFVANGSYDAIELKNQIDPEPKNITELDKLLGKFNDPEIFQTGESEIRELLNKLKTTLEESKSLNTVSIIGIIGYYGLYREILGIKVKKINPTKIKELLIKNAENNDTSFSFDSSTFYSSLKKYWEPHLGNYFDLLKRKQSQLAREELLSCIREDKFAQFLNLLEKDEQNLVLFINELDGDLKHLWKENPALYYKIFSVSIGRLRRSPLISIEEKKILKEKIKTYLKKISNSSKADLMDKYRSNIFLNDVDSIIFYPDQPQ